MSDLTSGSFSDLEERKKWLEERCHQLKHNQGVAPELIAQMQTMRTEKKLSRNSKDEIRICQTYFENNWQLMNFSQHVRSNLPIGSGVVEAACKTIVKQRLCRSGMMWSNSRAQSVLRLRALTHTDGRWEQLWNKINRFGFNLAA